LLTKWVPKPGPVTREQVRAAVQRSLDRLQTDGIDLLQFHAWNYADPRWLDCLFWLQELKEQGLIRHLGLTNFDTAHLRIVVHSGIEVVSNQVYFSLIDQRPQQRMTELCLQHEIKLLCYGTVAGGFLSERWLGKPEPAGEALATWSQMKYKRFIDAAGGWEVFQQLLSVADEAARRLGVSIANLACRYILEQPTVGGIIIGARLGESEHIQENLRLFQFALDEASRSSLRAAMEKLRPIPGDCGDEYRQPPFLTASGDLSHHLKSMPPPCTAQFTPDGRSRVLSGTVWEAIAGFSRAVRIGKHIYISGTTATHGARAIGGTDAAAQLHFVIDKIEGALHSLGARLQDVVRTRLYVRHLADWDAVARAHGERFRDIQPANTLVQAALVGDEYLVEMEAEAVVAGTGDEE
jgi:aryl-alcohol dehydrogenase-like predicted oxidoreductase/enamine deaminase RidA (YjgF/YER057c/UK114 family)